MKKTIAFTIVLTLVLATISGCTKKPNDGPEGGSVGKGERFKIDVPTFSTTVKQGETQSVTLSLDRGESFKPDVTLEIQLVNQHQSRQQFVCYFSDMFLCLAC